MLVPAVTALDTFIIWAGVAFFCGVALVLTAARLARAALNHPARVWAGIAAILLLVVGCWAFVFACQAGEHEAWGWLAPAYLLPGHDLWTQEQSDLGVCQTLGWVTVALTALLVALSEWLLSRPLARRALRQAERPAQAARLTEHSAHEQLLQYTLLPLAIGKPQPARQEWLAPEQNNDSASFQVFSTPLSAPAWPGDE
jgi:hypothetical protein